MPAQTKTTYFPLGGGLDIVTPALSVKPGMALALVNYEPWFNGGYRRVYGYERIDGQPAPSEQVYDGFDVDDASSLTLGDVITDDITGATGVCCGIWIDDGTHGTDVIGIFKTAVATFDNGDTCNSAAFTLTSAAIEKYAPTAVLEDTWNLYAQDDYRSDILELPGAGPALGAWQRGSNIYGVRDNAGGTAGILHKTSAAGWTTSGITMAEYMYFNTGGGTTNQPLPAEGDTIEGATSGATATVHRVITHGGSVAANSAYGYLVLTSVAGGPFTDTEQLETPSGGAGTHFANADGVNVPFVFSPDGVYRFVNHNFYGGVSTYRTYGVNGVDPAFEIDENNVVSPILFPLSPIDDQPSTTTPFLIEEHRNYIFLASTGGSFYHSVIGEPMNFNGFLGAAEFGIGDEVTGMNSVVGGVLVVTSERETRGLFGKNSGDWEMKLIGEKTGGLLHTAAKMDTVYSLDNMGITSVSRTDTFGSFAGATVSQLVQPLVNVSRPNATCANITRSSNQYRLYFNDGTALIMFVPNAGMEPTNRSQTRTKVEFGQLSYTDHVQSMYNTENASGEEVHYFVSDNGYVYQDQKGNNFDGGVIRSTVRLVYNQIGSPSYKKKYRRAILEMESQKPLTLKVIHDLSYGGQDNKSGNQDLSIDAGGGLWDVDNWDEFFWDGQAVSTASVGLGGSGTNISLLIYNESATARPFIMQGMTIHYDLRRLQR